MRVAQRAAGKTVFSGVGKTEAEMDAALRAGILLFNLESEAELERLSARAAKLKRRAAVAFRVNPDVNAETHPYISTGMREHKFGVPIAEAERLYAEAARQQWLEVAGVSVHIGSQIMSEAPFAETMERLAGLIKRLQFAGHRVRFVDAGGGLGNSYTTAEDDAAFRRRVRSYAQALRKPLRRLK